MQSTFKFKYTELQTRSKVYKLRRRNQKRHPVVNSSNTGDRNACLIRDDNQSSENDMEDEGVFANETQNNVEVINLIENSDDETDDAVMIQKQVNREMGRKFKCLAFKKRKQFPI